MTVLEKLQEVSACAKNCRIVLFREGMFWKAYQQAAYLFVSNLRQYQVNRNYVKKVGEDVLSLGFPVPSSAKILSGVNYEEDEERISIPLSIGCFCEEDYLKWRESVTIQPVVSRKPSRNELLAYKHTYDLLLDFYRLNRNVAREYKFSLCEKIKDELHEALMAICFAAERDSVTENLDKARRLLCSAKIRIRLLNDLRQIPLKHYAALAEQFSVLLSEIDKWKAAM